MRILQINAVYKTKSTGRIAMEMHQFFQSNGIESYVAYGTENTDSYTDSNVFQIGNVVDHKVHALAYRIDHMQGCHSTIATKAFIKKIANIRPDIILTHNLHSNYLNVPMLFRAIKDMGIKLVVCLHDCWFLTGGCYHYTATGCTQWLEGCRRCSPLGKAAAKKYKINCDMFEYVNPTIVATSKWIEGEARKSLLSSRSDIRMIYDWIDRKTFYPRDPKHIREKLGIGDKTMILGVATGWGPDKGQNEMIAVAKAMPEAVIVLVGSQAVPVKYPDNVKLIPFTDSKDELAEFYSAADVFFNPSKQETFGLVSGEALACGTPLIVYNTTACPEFVAGNTGLIMDNGDAYKAVKNLLNNIEIVGKDTVSEECRKFAEHNFDMKTNMMQYIDLFHRVL